jgi:hypothetical protein
MTPPLHIDPHALIAFRDGRAVPLSVSEWRMLRLLLATGLIDDARRTLAALVALQQLPDAMPAPEPPLGITLRLFDMEAA